MKATRRKQSNSSESAHDLTEAAQPKLQEQGIKAAVIAGEHADNWEPSRRHKLPFSAPDLQKLLELRNTLTHRPRASSEWQAAYAEIVKNSWYLEFAGSQAEFDQQLGNLPTAERQEGDVMTGQVVQESATATNIEKVSGRKLLSRQKRGGNHQPSDLHHQEHGPKDVKLTAARRPGTGREANDLEHWADRINAQVARSAEDLVELGRLFCQAKAKLKHGDWQALFETGNVRFSLRWAQKLMQVAKNDALTKAKNSALLPPSPDALSTLARLQPDLVQTGIDSGEIHPGMTIADVKQFVLDQESRSEPLKNENTAFDYNATLKGLLRRVQKTLARVPSESTGDILKDLMKELGVLHASTQQSQAA